VAGGRRSPTREDAYSGPRAAELAGIPYYSLHAWTRRGLVTPSVKRGRGTGNFRLFSLRDIVALRAIGRLRDQGVSLDTIAAAVKTLTRGTRLGESPLADYTFLARGKRVYILTADPSTALDISHGAQLVFSITLGGATPSPVGQPDGPRRPSGRGTVLWQRAKPLWTAALSLRRGR
jgi:DNA-binding transcriptional MerR regulator